MKTQHKDLFVNTELLIENDKLQKKNKRLAEALEKISRHISIYATAEQCVSIASNAISENEEKV